MYPNVPGGGSPNPGDYSPDNCNPDPNYTVPTIPPPPGTEYQLPCSSVAIPTDPTASNGATQTTVTPAQFIIQKLGITDIDKITFISNPSSGLSNAFAQYLIREQNSPYSIEFGQWLFDYLYANPTIDYHDFLDQNEFSGISSLPLNILDDPEIQNGILVDILPDITTSQVGALLARTAARNNTEDMEFGSNANFKDIMPSAKNMSTEGLFLNMKALLIFFSMNDHQMQIAAMDFLDRFRSNIGGVYSHPTLTNKVKGSSEFKNFVKKFGDVLATELRKTNGNINDLAPITLGFRPAFNNNWSKLNGLTILLNDTEKTDINLESYSVTNAHWIANVYITIIDHFGLDRHDAAKYQSVDPGFAAWWVLQHDRNYKPFQTKITIRTKIEGDL